MPFADKVLNRLTGSQPDRIFLRKLNHALDGSGVGAALVGEPRKSGHDYFVNRIKLATGKLFLDDSLLFGSEFNSHKRRQPITPSRYENSGKRSNGKRRDGFSAFYFLPYP